MKKLWILLIFTICFTFMPTHFALAEDVEPTFVITAKSACAYLEADITSSKINAFSNKDKVSIQFEEGLPKEYGESFVFYRLATPIVDDGQQYFYIMAELVTKESDVIVQIPNYNGKTNSESVVYFKQNSELVESDITLKKNQEIFLYEGFNQKSKYSAIAFMYDGNVEYGYILTSTVSPNGINPLIITSATIILALVGIALAWVFIKRKKVKLKAKKMT